MLLIKLISLLLITTSCSTISYPITAKKYKDDLVSTQTAIDLAFSAYLKSCVDIKNEFKLAINFNECQKKAKAHVNKDIIFILDQ
ncbi:MAG: hypothetical protein HOJ35_03025 [Bdellovibrionales bacterium]|jgi:hypothetical protein|nr:hypothetical protein [Bdellovibrionales bacterium]